MKIKQIFFDIDGTILNSEPGLCESLVYMFGKMGWQCPEKEALKEYLGPVLYNSLKDLYGIQDDALIFQARDHFRDHYNATGIYHFTVYDGAKFLLESLHKNGTAIYAASCKVPDMTEIQLKHCGLMQYFSGIFGSSPTDNSVTKQIILQRALGKLNAKATESIMIGDRASDIVGGKNLGMKTIAVSYGYGPAAELKEADFLAESAAQIGEILKTLEG